MTQTYPTSGYRTGAAARAGFQSFESRFMSQSFRSPSSPSARDLETILQQAFRPSAGRTPVRTGPGASIVPKVSRAAVSLGTTALTRHPVFRAAELAWNAGQFVHEQMSTKTTKWGLELGGGWIHCRDCDTSREPNHNGGSSGPTVYYCNSMTQCYYNQGAPTLKPIASVPSNHTWMWVAHRFPVGTSSHHWSGHSNWIRPIITGQPTTVTVIPPRPAAVISNPVPMPVPYRLAPYRQNSSTREAGYSTQTSSRRSPPPDGRGNDITFARHRRPGKRTRERKFTLMSGGKLRNLIEMAFEGVEQIGIFHAALPKDCQAPQGATAAAQFAAVFGCLHRIDGCKVIEGQLNNWIEDKIVGALGQAAKRSVQGAGGNPAGTGKSYSLAGITKKLGKPYFAEDGSLQFDPTLPFEIPKVSIC